MKRILVTGAAGFLGSHLCDRLLKDGNKIIAVDNLITGSSDNIDHLNNNDNFDFIKHNIKNDLKIEKNLDEIYNLASPASPIHYQEHPIETLYAGSVGVDNLLKLAKKHDAKFLQTSTSEVYGDPKVSPQKETYWGNVNPIGPRSCYDESKRFGEALIMTYHRKHNLDTKIVRIFNTYGPRMAINDGRAIPAFCSQALEGKPLTVFGDGKQTRSFCYVDDQINGIMKLMNSDYNEPVNIGNPNEFTIKELAHIILETTNSESELSYKPLPKDDPKQRRPDISLAKDILDWEPRVNIKEGIVPTLDYFKEKLKIKSSS